MPYQFVAVQTAAECSSAYYARSLVQVYIRNRMLQLRALAST